MELTPREELTAEKFCIELGIYPIDSNELILDNTSNKTDLRKINLCDLLEFYAEQKLIQHREKYKHTKEDVDIYSGDLNTERIQQYLKLEDLFNVDVSTIREIFNKGAEWGVTISNKEQHEQK